MGIKSKRRLGRIEVALALVSILMTLAVLEIGYRVKLSSEANAARATSAAPTYTVYNDSIAEFSREFGYSYMPNKAYVSAWIHNGYPVACSEGQINEMGNRGRIKGDYAAADMKILVFGDSFTAIPNDGLTWPDLLQDKLEGMLSEKVSVVNFGRDGYGVLQMVDLASVKVQELKPDLVIIAFITDDLTRARFWRTVNYLNGEKRLFTSTEPSEKADPRKSTDTVMLNSSLTKEWCESMLASRKPDDPLLAKLHDQFWRLKRENEFPIDLTSLSISFLANRIVHKDPFHGLTRPSRNPRISFDSYAADARLMANLGALIRSNVPIQLVHLSEFEELRDRHYILDGQQEALLRSLQQLANKEAISLVDRDYDGNGTRSTDDLKKLFLFPYDAHPSLRGLDFYAEQVSQELVRK